MIRRDAEILRLDLRRPGARGELSLKDLEVVRLVLRGGSPIDWHRLNLSTLSDVDDLLRANLLDPDSRRDCARLAYLHRDALRYLKRNFAFRFPPEVESPEDVRHLFLYASETGRMNRVQILSCVVLKTMHTINHLQARELLLETPVSEAELIGVVEEQILARARGAIAEGVPIVHFYGSRKGRDSMVSKLLSKKAARASEILDRLRFRIVTETRDDILPVLAHLLRHVFPWNQVAAGQSSNNLIDLSTWIQERDELRTLGARMQVDLEDERTGLENEFSGDSYRMINFILDVPVRLDHLLSRAGDPWMLQKGSIVYVACEFQVVDQETAYVNEQGENSHARYKLRQRRRVGERLMWGLLGEHRHNGRTGPGRLARRPRRGSPLAAHDEAADTQAPRRPPRAPRPGLPPVVRDFSAVSDADIAVPGLVLEEPEEDSMLEPFRLGSGEQSVIPGGAVEEG